METPGSLTKVDYFGPFVYETVNGERSLKYLITEEGRVVKSGTNWIWEYNQTDHLGDVRTVVRRNATTGLAELVQDNHYFPFGMLMSDISTSSTDNRFRYNGKEYQNDLGFEWYDYGARFYDPALARWHSMDPMAEMGRRWSPYCYGFDNPMRFEDPDGMWPWEAKNVRNARKEAKRAGVEPKIWKNESTGKSWASVDYAKSRDYKGTAHSDVKAFKPEGKSWGEKYRDSFIGKLIKGGGGDEAQTGKMTKEGWKRTGLIVGTMASGGALLEAATTLEICLGVTSLAASADDLKNNVTGKTENEKGLVAGAKKGISFLGSAKGLIEISETISSPFQIISTTMDMISTIKNAPQKKDDSQLPKK